MEVTQRSENGAIVLTIKGIINAETAQQFETEVFAAEETSKTIVLNMKDLEYISSAGLRVLLMAEKKLKPQKGCLIIVELSQAVQKVFKISGFYALFKIFKTEKQALDQLPS